MKPKLKDFSLGAERVIKISLVRSPVGIVYCLDYNGIYVSPSARAERNRLYLRPLGPAIIQSLDEPWLAADRPIGCPRRVIASLANQLDSVSERPDTIVFDPQTFVLDQ